MCLENIEALQDQIITGTNLLTTELSERQSLIATSFQVFGLPAQRRDDFQALVETLWTTGLAQGEALIVPVFPPTEETRMDCDKLTAPYRQRINDIYMQISENRSRTLFLTTAFCRDLEVKLDDLVSAQQDEIRKLKLLDDKLAQLIFDAGNDLDGTAITAADATAWLSDATTAARAGTLNGQDTTLQPEDFPPAADLGATLCGAAPNTAAVTTALNTYTTDRAELVIFLQLVTRLEQFADAAGLLDEDE